MHVGVFFPLANEEHFKVLLDFSKGVGTAVGDSVDFRPLPLYKSNNDYDVCVVFGVNKESVPDSRFRGYVIECEKMADKDVIILEKGYIRRDEYYSAGLNGLNGNALFNNQEVPADRFKALGVRLNPWRHKTKGSILLIGQVPWDASVQHLAHAKWVRNTARVIKEYTDRPIVFRPHPFAPAAIKDVPGVSYSHRSLSHDLNDAVTVVTHNSNTGVDAVLAGVPTFCASSGSMLYPYAAVGLETIENPPMWDREKWANSVAYAQWSHVEMSEGLPWRRLKELIIKRREDAAA